MPRRSSSRLRLRHDSSVWKGVRPDGPCRRLTTPRPLPTKTEVWHNFARLKPVRRRVVTAYRKPRLSTAYPPHIHRTSTAIAAFGAVEMRRISGGFAKREKTESAKTRRIRRKRLMDVSGKGIRVEGRGPTPTLSRGRQALGKGRRRFVATNCLRPSEGGASPRQLRFEFVATNPEALSSIGSANVRSVGIEAPCQLKCVIG